MSKFGWSYPAGAANDPNAPYNQDPNLDNNAIMEAFLDHDSPYDLYHSVYKYGSCGHNIGFAIYGVFTEDNGETGPAGVGGVEESHAFYCDDLRQFGNWEQMDEQGFLITGIYVSSIIEGVDETTETIYIEWDQENLYPKELAKLFWQACDDIEKSADDIWMQTHGCDACREHWNGIGNGELDEFDLIPVWTDCPDCKGQGIPI